MVDKQTFGTFLKTFFTGKYVGKDIYGNKYYKNKSGKRWVIYSDEIEATKFHLNGIYGCIIQQIKFLIKWIKNTVGKKGT